MGLFHKLFPGSTTILDNIYKLQYLKDYLPTHSIHKDSVVIDLKDLWPRGLEDRHPVTIRFEEVDSINIVNEWEIVPPDKFALNSASRIMKWFKSGARKAYGPGLLEHSEK